MTTSEHELKKIASLAYIETNTDSALQLANDVSAIMDFVEQLRQMDTSNVKPLLHPLNLHQRLRADDVKVQDCRPEFAKMTPLFADNLYLVPKLGPFI